MKQNVKNLTIIGLLVSVFLSIIKIIGGKVGNSSALIADGIHSISDCITDFMILFSSKYWAKDADREHQYGHGKIEFVVSFCIGIFLILVAVEILIDAAEKIFNNESNIPHIMCFAIAFFSFLAKEGIYRWHNYYAKKINSTAFYANALHHRSDGFSSLIIAFSLFLAIYFPSIKYLDQIAAVIVALFIVKLAIDVLIPSFNSLIDKSLDEKTTQEINDFILSFPDVVGMHGMRSRIAGNGAYLDVHVQVKNEMTIYEAHKVSHKLKAEILKKFPKVLDVLIHIEPEND